MEHVSSEVQDASLQDRSTGSETSIRSPLCDYAYTRDSDLRSTIEENAFQALSEGSLIKRPRYTFCVSEPDEDNDFFSLTFPRKLWKIVESDRFKSIWWDENGTSIVINEELFKKEVLGRKSPFRIFETDSMKSLIRQLNLYGFSKVQPNFQRSASLADFLAKEKDISVLSKLQFYHNPNFRRGCPQLLGRMKRRIGIKNASPVSASSVQDLNKKYFIVGGNNTDNQNSSFIAETSRESLFSPCTSLNVPLTREPLISQTVANTIVPIRNEFSLPSTTSVIPSEQLADKCAVLNQMTTYQMHSHSSYSQTNGSIVNIVTTTTSASQYIISHIQNSYFGLIAELPSFATGHPNLPANEVPFCNLLQAGNPWFPVAVIADPSATSLSRSALEPSLFYQHYPNFS
ncbi:heat shock transcription factor, Y-linked-like [Choloepus didactylus]|uniref:heat shock transcription factor, Y-linked-like n=1 Tax=Choloepus didactylus TaxID=27675 RepID=UPI00189ED587|nr:heat shock transcription factor, Y-linked-like [Choloepus didactylus]